MASATALAAPPAARDLDAVQPRVLDIGRWTRVTETREGVTVAPYGPTGGGWVTGLNIDAVSPGLRQFLYSQILERGFLAFAPGTVDAARFAELVGLFGTPKYMGTPYTPKSSLDTAVNSIDTSIKKTRANYIWHIDQAFRPQPTRFTALFGEVVPSLGGDTLFSNATAAYDLLDPLFANYVDTLTAVQSYDAQGFLTNAYAHDPVKLEEQRKLYPPVEAPVIKVHPETGRKQIFVNELYTVRILGLSPIASQSLLNILYEAIKAPEVQSRFRWQPGAALIWDNYTVQHRGVHDFGAERRVLHRAVIE